ncbi:MAG TPA: sugar transferase [Ktedonobacterales bacterium]|jgi:lipopolysaccharide/colanic/teichoic acid biosynthesis glycosyltransferase
MKRSLDVVVAAITLLVLSPILLFVACAVWVNDPGPIFFRHQRIGRGFRPFHVIKFRTMRQAQSLKSELTFRNDPRVTAVGRFLRYTKLDEIPQLVNVLRGEMSLVGPRPESPQYVAHYNPEQRLILLVRPGLTGPASVRYRHQEKLLSGPDYERFYVDVIMPAKLAINLEYVRHHPIWVDLVILLKTVWVVLTPFAPPPVSEAAVRAHTAPRVPIAQDPERAVEWPGAEPIPSPMIAPAATPTPVATPSQGVDPPPVPAFREARAGSGIRK